MLTIAQTSFQKISTNFYSAQYQCIRRWRHKNEYDRLCLPESYKLGKERDINECLWHNVVKSLLDNRQGLREDRRGCLAQGGRDRGEEKENGSKRTAS